MSEVINAYRSIAASPELRELERMRVRASHDEAQALKIPNVNAMNIGKMLSQTRLPSLPVKMLKLPKSKPKLPKWKPKLPSYVLS